MKLRPCLSFVLLALACFNCSSPAPTSGPSSSASSTSSTGTSTGTGGAGGATSCSHFGEPCTATDGRPGKVGAADAATCVCCAGCFGQVDGRCQPGLITTACGKAGEVCGDCMSKACGKDQLCHTACYSADGTILPNGTPCIDESSSAKHCFGGVCQDP